MTDQIGAPEDFNDAQSLMVIANRIDGLLVWLGPDHIGHHMIKDMPGKVREIAIRLLVEDGISTPRSIL